MPHRTRVPIDADVPDADAADPGARLINTADDHNGATPPQPPLSPPSGGVAHDDWLRGAAAIALFLHGTDDRKARKRVYHSASRGRIPCGKDGNQLVARRSLILEHLERLATSKSKGLLT